MMMKTVTARAALETAKIKTKKSAILGANAWRNVERLLSKPKKLRTVWGQGKIRQENGG